MSRTGIARAINILDAARKGEEEADEAIEDAIALLDSHLRGEDEGGHDPTCRVKVKMSRGDGPRDSEEWTIEGRGASAEEAAIEFDSNFERYKERWGAEARRLDPEPEQ
jgi:hypothetical protein